MKKRKRCIKCLLLTPIAKKPCLTEKVLNSDHGLQVLGGHGYIANGVMEQKLYENCRISMAIIEGTTVIQAFGFI